MKINFDKYPDGLVPAIVQDAGTRIVLMLGFMNREALKKTLDTKLVTFYSRSRKKLWTKGETSKNYLKLAEVLPDCDNDTLLIKAIPTGPVCHTGNDTCFKEINSGSFLNHLEEIIESRKKDMPEESYTASLFKKGMPRMAQKVGEEAVEVVVEAMRQKDDLFKNEAADLVFHLLVLLHAKGMNLADVISVLESRHS